MHEIIKWEEQHGFVVELEAKVEKLKKMLQRDKEFKAYKFLGIVCINDIHTMN